MVQLGALGLVIAIIALFAVGMVNRSAQPVERGAAPQINIPLYGGGTFSLAAERGKVVVVNFWASWCQPCRDEAPVLESTWRDYKDRDVVFIGVDYVDTDKEALAFIKEFGVTYPNGPDIGTQASQAYHIQGVPETYFVGRDGNLYGNHIGPIDVPTLTDKIEELLKP
ncbi:MAG: TlpA family protein disulfide reductase [Chloroflexi bacterium]|nr:TlpA family protein disulfide reductase [Chloroflexota bacterium]